MGKGCQNNTGHGQLTAEVTFPLSPLTPDNLVSRDRFGCPVPRQRADSHIETESGVMRRLAKKSCNVTYYCLHLRL